ncbi:MAG: 30S ribosome-binding factor RbfA [Candidatus Omnitrophica bacterium]|nr:30S ribosome-binding factor RbfA [Candidatus Omnitrophota bacterium]
MGSNRAAKLAGTLKKRLSEIIQSALKDPRIGFVTVTEVAVTQDLRHVKVYFSVFGSESEKKSAIIGLRHATGFIRQLIAKEVKLRLVPEIIFKFDETYEQQQRVNELLERIKRQDEQRSGGGNKDIKEV